MLDEQIEIYRRQVRPRWDHLRERRLLRSVEQRLEQAQARGGRPAWRVRIALTVSIAIGALLVGYFGGVKVNKLRMTQEGVASSKAAAVTSAIPVASTALPEPIESRTLADGSRLELSSGARVDVRSASSNRMELAQSGGRVRYVVAHDPWRAFVVLAEGVQLHVTGTVFVVEINAGKVSVHVEEGRVRVAALRGDVELGAGDQFNTSVYDATLDSVPAVLETDSAPSAQGGRRNEQVPVPAAGVLLARADNERRSGDLSSAAASLRQFLVHYPKDRRVAFAWFTLGRVERTRDRPALGAVAFRRCFSLAPEGPMAEDALAEEAAAWAAADIADQARAAAQRYMDRFPRGAHAARMRRILP
jgi:transmembrane sensor